MHIHRHQSLLQTQTRTHTFVNKIDGNLSFKLLKFLRDTLFVLLTNIIQPVENLLKVNNKQSC